jgi:hypothetical protein
VKSRKNARDLHRHKNSGAIELTAVIIKVCHLYDLHTILRPAFSHSTGDHCGSSGNSASLMGPEEDKFGTK